MGEAEMGSGLKTTLRSLCYSNGWSYGVFWSYDQRNSMLLTMEDAYYEEQMAALVDNMLLQVHLLGEGTIGEVALTGKHKWMSLDAHNGEGNSIVPIGNQDVFQDVSDFHGHFSSGIQTVAVISVESRGVVQFGSTHKVSDNLEFVDQTRRLLHRVGNSDESIPLESKSVSLNSESSDISAMFASLISSEYLAPGSSRDPIGNLCSLANVAKSSSFMSDIDISATSTPSHALSDIETITPPPYVGGCSGEGSILTSFEQPFGSENMIEDSSYLLSTEANALFENLQSILDAEVELPDVTSSLHRSLDEFNVVDFETDLSNPFSVDDLSQWLASSPDQSINPMETTTIDSSLNPVGVSSVLPSTVKDNASSHVPMKQPSNSIQSSLSDPLASENDIRHGFGFEFGECWENYIKPTVGSDSGFRAITTSTMSECITEVDAGAKAGSRKGLFSELGLEELINGVRNSGSASEDQISTNKRRKTETSSSNSNQAPFPKFSSSGAGMSLLPPFFIQDKNNLPCQKDVFPKPQVGSWIDDCLSINAENGVKATQKKPDKPMKVNKKRARPGESTRPRPKDRQQIQDRLKELRGIIPNGTKCSIDSLLDLTVKHMLFLQSITKYADKLKEAEEPKLISQENGVVLKDNGVADNKGGGGATWAFEVGDQSMVCPIIVEDLSTPGQMLIEMLCEERGFFLEIADVVRGFGLNICKGVMEIRKDKIWARFVVEANKHVTRMDIFWSLVQLLQQTNTNGIDSTNQLDNAVNGGFSLADNYQQPLLPVAASHQLC